MKMQLFTSHKTCKYHPLIQPNPCDWIWLGGAVETMSDQPDSYRPY